MVLAPDQPPPRGQAGRKRSDHAHRAILDAAFATLGEVGYHNLTMEGVAARAGVAKATVYRWWPSKAFLVLELVRDHLGEPIQPTGNSEHDVRAVVTVIVEMIMGLVGAVLLADVSREAKAGQQLEDLLGPYRAAHAGILLAAAGRGDLPYDVDARKVLEWLAGTVLYYKVMNRQPGAGLVDELTAWVLSGRIPRLATS
jgi:AcrR family transcriptional regulator